MNDKVQTVGELYKLYAETPATGLSVIGPGDYGIEAEWLDGQRFLVIIGVNSLANANDFAAFLTSALPAPKSPRAVIDEQRERRGMWGGGIDPLQSERLIINPFKRYNVVCLMRNPTRDDQLPEFPR